MHIGAHVHIHSQICIFYFQKLQGELDHKVLTVFHWDYTLVWLRVVEANSIYQQHEDAVIAYIPPKKSSDGNLKMLISPVSLQHV